MGEMPTLATAEDLATYLRETVDTSAAEQVLDIAEGMVQSFTGQTISLVTDDEIRLMAPSGSRLWLPQIPAQQPTVVTIDGVAISPLQWAWYPKGYLGPAERSVAINWSGYDNPSSWASIGQFVDVTYTHGYAVIPAAVKGVVLSAAARLFQNPAALSSERIGDYSYAQSTEGSGAGLTAGERAQLKPFKHRVRSIRLVTS